jgi:eukaryotic-like serine/threonine-protein kinase
MDDEETRSRIPADGRDLSGDQWNRIKAIFYEAVERPSGERAAFVESACANDPALRDAVQALLASDLDAKSFLEHPPAPIDTIAHVEPGLQPGGDETTHLRPQRSAIGALPVRAVVGSTSSQPLEVRDLLHRRLRILTLITLGTNGVFNALRFLRLDFSPIEIREFMIPAGLYLFAMAIVARMLWGNRVYTLVQLRRIEAAFFGLTTLYFVGETYFPLFGSTAWLVLYAQRHVSELSILARQPSIIWMAVIVAYGTFIPNTGRRCAVVTCLMAFSPVVTVTAAGVMSPVPSRSLFVFVSEMAMWLGVAVALAVYGSQKITLLRQEALAARNLGQYQLKQRLGRGGMGEVYLAEHKLLRRPCAVKVIRPDQAGDPQVLQRFLREVQITSTLTHPNTVQVFDYGQANDGTVFYAMEYLTGPTLDEIVRAHGPMGGNRTIFVLRQLCGALTEAHLAGLIHRDIKPGNVILCSRGGLHDVAKLLDFGLARIQALDPGSAGMTAPGMIFGTPAFMSPEQAAGRSLLDARSDIYSLGALAYFLVNGQPPFVRDTIVQVLAAHLNDAPRSLRPRCSISEQFEGIVLRCLAKDPAMRFSTVVELEHALAACPEAGGWTTANAAEWWAGRSAGAVHA